MVDKQEACFVDNIISIRSSKYNRKQAWTKLKPKLEGREGDIICVECTSFDMIMIRCQELHEHFRTMCYCELISK